MLLDPKQRYGRILSVSKIALALRTHEQLETEVAQVATFPRCANSAQLFTTRLLLLDIYEHQHAPHMRKKLSFKMHCAVLFLLGPRILRTQDC